MKSIVSILQLLLIAYALLSLGLYLFQRKLLYFPTAIDDSFNAEQISFHNQGVKLHGWVVNPGRDKALIYFGGNSEPITQNGADFESIFADYSVYLVEYRGYGRSQGKPSETALFSDALLIYDALSSRHDSISLLGRSLGSGVAVYLAAHRGIDKLILLTPYDSIAAVAQRHYPLFPVNWLMRDRFDSVKWGRNIAIPVLLVTAGKDEVVPLQHGEALMRSLTKAEIDYRLIADAAHNDITAYAEYQQALREFMLR